MTDNLNLWNAVEKTPASQVKEITGKAYKGNSPKPHYLVWKATETFGPAGIGWGFEIVEEKLLDGALLEPGFYERIHMARVRVWYKWNGERGEVEHVGQTAFSGRRKSRDNTPGLPFTDEDAPKKSVTDALIKALSMIGFAGDIFMGRYDDSKYVNDLRAEEAAEKRGAAAKAPVQQRADAPKGDKPNAAFEVMGNGPDDFATRVIALVKDAPDAATIQAIRDANAGGLTRLHKDNKALWDSVMQAMSNRTTDVMEKAA